MSHKHEKTRRKTSLELLRYRCLVCEDEFWRRGELPPDETVEGFVSHGLCSDDCGDIYRLWMESENSLSLKAFFYSWKLIFYERKPYKALIH